MGGALTCKISKVCYLLRYYPLSSKIASGWAGIFLYTSIVAVVRASCAPESTGARMGVCVSVAVEHRKASRARGGNHISKLMCVCESQHDIMSN